MSIQPGALALEHSRRPHEQATSAAKVQPPIPDDVAGPIVRAVVDQLKAANATVQRKTIAQMIDEALEQEFPEEKQEVGKNFNESSQNADVSHCAFSDYTAR